MATKRQKRIDPSAAFASIVGAAETAPEEEARPESTVVETPPAAPAPPKAEQAPAPAPTIEAAAQAPQAQPAQTADAPAARKLVQKGYYLYEDQAKQLAVYAAITGADKSSIVRAALHEYFENHPAGQ